MSDQQFSVHARTYALTDTDKNNSLLRAFDGARGIITGFQQFVSYVIALRQNRLSQIIWENSTIIVLSLVSASNLWSSLTFLLPVFLNGRLHVFMPLVPLEWCREASCIRVCSPVSESMSASLCPTENILNTASQNTKKGISATFGHRCIWVHVMCWLDFAGSKGQRSRS